jgi:YtkA-like
MRPTSGVSLLLGALALTWALAGCGRSNEQAAAPPAGGGPAAAGAALGTPHAAGPFQVTLSTDPAPPKAGETRFQAKVSRDGQPVSAASVSLSLSMPSMSMKGPDVALKPAGDHYGGAASLAMAGEWEAKVTVTAGGATGTTTYRFSASQ